MSRMGSEGMRWRRYWLWRMAAIWGFVLLVKGGSCWFVELSWLLL